MTNKFSNLTAALALGAILTFLAGGCAETPQLMPTPNVYAHGDLNPFPDVQPALQSSTVDVLYITDRAPLNDDLDNRQYGYGRSRSTAFGISQVTFGKKVSWPDLVKASTSAMRNVDLAVTVTSTRELGRFQPTPKSLFELPTTQPTPDDAQATAEAEFRKTLAGLLERTKTREVFISVHGVANQHIHSVSRIAELWHFLGREGVPIAYSWPSGSPGLKAYMYDRESSEFTVFHLKQALKLIASCPEVSKIHLIGHSRGTDVVSTALRELHIEYEAAGKSPRKELKLGTLVLAAPDMDVQVTIQRCSTSRIGFDPERFALYVGQEDKLLQVSNWLFGGFTRLGSLNSAMFTAQELAALQKTRNPQIIDTHISDPGSGGHDYFVSNPAVSSDLILLLRYGRDPGADSGRPLRTDAVNGFWVIDDKYPERLTNPTPRDKAATP